MTDAATWENLISLLQMLTMAAAGFWLLYRYMAAAAVPAVYFLAGSFFCSASADLFFLLYNFLRGDAPQYFSAADIGWIGSYFFLTAALLTIGQQRAGIWPSAALTAVTVAVNLLLSYLYGHFFTNMLWAAAMVPFAWLVGKGLPRPFYLSLCCFLLLELDLFLSWGTVYIILDASVTVSLLFVCYAFRYEIPETSAVSDGE